MNLKILSILYTIKIFTFFGYLNLKLVEVVFKYTNQKSKKRKLSSKYFIGDFDVKDVKTFSTIFSKWVEDNNDKRKYKILNTAIQEIQLLDAVTVWGDNFGQNLFQENNYQEINLKDLAIVSIVNLFKKPPSINPKDYVICNQIELSGVLAKVKFKSIRGNIREKNKAFIYLTNKNHNGVALFSKSYPEGMARKSIDLSNRNEPYRAIEFLDWKIFKKSETLLI